MEQFPPGSATVRAGSNHDVPRAATRWAEGDPRRARLAQTILAMLPGTYVLYYGDELGMTDSDIPADLHRDPLTAGGLNGQWPRDNARAPMRWDASEVGGFTTGTPWLPVHPVDAHNVADQRADPTSMLSLVRALIALRRSDLCDPSATYRAIDITPTHWVFSSGALHVQCNFSAQTVDYQPLGTPILSSDSVRPQATSKLTPWEAVVSRTTPLRRLDLDSSA